MSVLVAAAPGRAEFVLEQAINYLLETTTIRGLRIRIPPQGYERITLERLAREHRADLIFAKTPTI